MIKRIGARSYLFWLLVALALAACGRSSVEETTATPVIEVAAEPTEELTPEPTSTPTPEPSPTPTPEPTIAPPATIITYEDENHGVTLSYPDNWYVEADQNAVFVFSDRSIRQASKYEEGAVLFLSTSSRLAELEAEVILDLFVDQFDLVSDQELISEPAALAINDQEAAQTIYKGNVEDVPVIVTYTAISGGDIGAAIISVMLQAEEELFGETLANITGSIILFTPPGANGENDAVFPRPDDVENLREEQASAGDESQINYETGLSLEGVIEFYRQELTAQGLVERQSATVIDDATFSLIFDDPENGRAIIIQGVDLDGTTNVNVRFQNS